MTRAGLAHEDDFPDREFMLGVARHQTEQALTALARSR